MPPSDEDKPLRDALSRINDALQHATMYRPPNILWACPTVFEGGEIRFSDVKLLAEHLTKLWRHLMADAVRTHAIILHNTVEANGKTIRENNLEITHAIPLKTLVEVVLPSSEENGLRAFVCSHDRDCDGTPLYSLYYSRDFENLEYIKKHNVHVYRAMITSGFSDSSLVVIS